MSDSVWFPEVDKALVQLFTDTIKIPNHVNGELQSVPVYIRRPDQDFKVEKYPCVTIYNLFSKYNPERQGAIKTVVSRDFENSTLEIEKEAVPFDLYYTFDFWSKTMTDANNMSFAWYTHFDRCFNLTVTDRGGTERSCYAVKNDILRKYDFVSGDGRVFHSTVKYKIQVELDENIRTTMPMVTDVDIRPYAQITIIKEGLKVGKSEKLEDGS